MICSRLALGPVTVGRLAALQRTRKTPYLVNRSTATVATSNTASVSHRIWNQIRKRPIEYASIPCVAAFVGILTNWMGVKMLFYPIEYAGIDLKRWEDTPYGLFGWQGAVPTKTQQMATRLVGVVTKRLLSLEEAFGRLEPKPLSTLLLPAVEAQVREDCGEFWYIVLKPVLPILLPRLLSNLQGEIEQIFDLHHVVLSAFLRDKKVLVDLFQKVGGVELEFLVNSGFGFGFLLGLFQTAAWARAPKPWTLPAAGALVGYVTNWIASKLLFEPAEPVSVAGMFEVQGLFESRQLEVSDEFGAFMKKRVLTPAQLFDDLSNGGNEGELYEFLRRQLPFPIPSHILSAAVAAIQKVARNHRDFPELHYYVAKQLDIDNTLASRLKELSPTDFEDLLHPVFKEDEMTLILTGGVLGLIAGVYRQDLSGEGLAQPEKPLRLWLAP